MNNNNRATYQNLHTGCFRFSDLDATERMNKGGVSRQTIKANLKAIGEGEIVQIGHYWVMHPERAVTIIEGANDG